MGVSINNVTVEELKSGIDFLLEGEKMNASDAPVAVRTAKGIDAHFYLDIEGGRFLITPDSFYADGKAKGKAKKDALTATERRQLADAFDALMGIVCEQGYEAFDSFHKRRGSKMMTELETIFKKLAPVEMEALNY